MLMQHVNEQIQQSIISTKRSGVVFQQQNLLNSDLASCMAVFALCLYLNKRKHIHCNAHKAEINQQK